MTSLHERNAFQLNKILNGIEQLLDWLNYGRTILSQKVRTKDKVVNSCRRISRLPLMWKLLASIISEHFYSCLEEENILLEEQEDCERNSRETKDQVLLDKTVLRDCKRRRTILAMAWIEYRKVYDLVDIVGLVNAWRHLE